VPSEYPECAHMKCPNMDVCVCVCVCVHEVVELGPLWPAGWHNHGSEQFRVSHSSFVEWHGNETMHYTTWPGNETVPYTTWYGNETMPYSVWLWFEVKRRHLWI